MAPIRSGDSVTIAKEVVLRFLTDNQGGTAGEEVLIRPLQAESREDEGFFYCLKPTEEGRIIR